MEEGYRCECGIYTKYTSYVYAHWETSLRHVCDCGREYTILRGIATMVKDNYLEGRRDG